MSRTKLHSIRFVIELLWDLEVSKDENKRVVIKKNTIFEGAMVTSRVIEQDNDILECATIRIDDGVLRDVPWRYFRFE